MSPRKKKYLKKTSVNIFSMADVVVVRKLQTTKNVTWKIAKLLDYTFT